MQKNEIGPFIPSTYINSKCVKYLNLKVKTIKLYKENIEGNIHNLGFGNGFLTMTPKAQTQKLKETYKLDFIKI